MTQPTIFIIYDPGLYGSFVSWWIRYADQSIDATPFDQTYSNSHMTMVDDMVVHLANVNHFKQCLSEDNNRKIYLLHPPREHQESERQDLSYLIEQVFKEKDSKIIFMNAPKSATNWVFANLTTKIATSWLEDEINNYVDLRPWGINFYSDAKIWQQREIVSYYLDQHIKNIHPTPSMSALVTSTFVTQHSDKLLTVNIEDLRDNIEDTLTKLAEFCNIDPKLENIQMVKQSWQQTQKYADSDQLINTIVNKTLNNEPFEWRPLLLIEEASIQQRLRLRGKKLKCYNLDQFPNNTDLLGSLLYSIELPNRIWFTGVPGSRWSGIAQILEKIPNMNTSDRTLEREYLHHEYSGHKGAYFGHGMEFPADPSNVDQAWTSIDGCRLIKSHEWIEHIEQIRTQYPDDWIMLVYRPDQSSFAWWHEAGGFQIKYPDYSAYKNSANMLSEIIRTNSLILEYAGINNCKWEYFTSNWIAENFGYQVNVDQVWPDILVTLIK